MERETINIRFRKLREAIDKSQEEMGKVLGITKSGISDIERGKRNVTEQHIIMLRNWGEYLINEEWLRSGTGNMFLDPGPMDLAFNHFGYIMGNSSAQKKAVLSALVEMMYHFPDDKWDYVFKQFEGCLADAKKEEEGF